MMVIKLCSGFDAKMVLRWETVFKCKHKSETLGKVLSVTQNGILISQSSVDKIGKLGPVEKIMLYIITLS